MKAILKEKFMPLIKFIFTVLIWAAASQLVANLMIKTWNIARINLRVFKKA